LVVIARDKREAFGKGAKRRNNPYFLVAKWIASLRSQ
jgi:hypothetical protein